MRKHSWFYTAVAVSGLLAGSMGTVATSQAGTYNMTPQSQWSVTKVEGNDAASGYCAMVRKYSHNVVLSIAKNEAGESSLALDFLTNSFEKSEKYKVTVSPGSGEKREYEVTPVSPQAIVMRLGESDEFMDALIASERLGVDVAEHEYTFEMTDLRAGQQSLVGCLDALDGQGAVELAEAKVETVAKTKVEDVDVEMPAMPSNMPKAEAVIAAAPTCSADKSENMRLGLENLTNKMNALTREKNAFSEQVVSLEKQLKQKETALMGLRQDKALLEQQLNDTSKMEDKDTQKLASLRKELEQSTARLQAAEDARRVLSDEVEQLQSSVRLYEARLVDEQDKVSSLELALSKAKDMAASVPVTAPATLLPTITKDTGEAEREVFRLGKLLEEQRVQCEADIDRMEKVLFDPELGDAQYQEMISSMQAELDNARAQLDQQRKDAKVAFDTQEKRLQSEIARLTKQVSLLEGEKALAMTKAQGASNSSHVTALEQSLAKLKSEREVLREQLAEEKRQAALKARRLSDLEEQFASMKEENVRLKSKVVDTDHTEADWIRDRADMQLKLAQLQESKARLMMQLSGEASDNAPMLETIAKLEGRVHDLEQQKVEISSKLSATQQKLERLKIENESYQKQIASVSDDRGALKNQLAIVSADKETLASQSSKLKIELAEVEQERNRLRSEVSQLSTSLKRTELEFANYKTSKELSADDAIKQIRLDSDRRVSELRSAQTQAIASAREKAELEKQAEIAKYKAKYEQRLTDAVERARLEKDAEFEKLKMAHAQELVNAVERAELEGRSKLVDLRQNQEDLVSAEVNKQIKILKEKHEAEMLAREQELVAAHQDEIERIKAMHAQDLDAFEVEQDMKMAKAVEKAGIISRAEFEKKLKKSDDLRYSQTVSELKDEQAGDLMSVRVAKSKDEAHPSDIMTPMMDQVTVAKVDKASFFDAGEVSHLLRQAHISLVDGVEPVRANGKNDHSVSYVWSSQNKMMGSLEQTMAKAGENFNAFVKRYLSGSEKRCSGEFAAVEGDVQVGTQSVSYEIACVPSMNSASASSASLLFTDINGVWSVFAHETDAANMADSMDARDKISAVLDRSFSSIQN